MSTAMPEISSSVRSAAEEVAGSISGSQLRKRGQARVHRVQPFSPWVQFVRTPGLGHVEGLVAPARVVVLQDVVGARD